MVTRLSNISSKTGKKCLSQKRTMYYIPDGPVSFKCQGNRKEYCDAKHYILEGIGDISDSICKKVSGIHFPSHGLPKAQQDVQGVK